ncbi:hypothetical protein CAPTEDRAFT_89522 [Capitella teleta]|uniref:Caspase family p20 domain-containing protein n=1 Tax=Capitella teleta TaxID=283909 RepID=R7U4D6_CAPTE|nr:hypothetical protein CAPTEDRAFT_89522 [Capitella teleta]|eukprot:ELT98035.1 hypothetical protein CAPTEDRAFT_89522 [Capitella teleta]
MSQAKRGRVLIINNEYFVDPNFSNREGSQYDTLNICELFENLHFETILKENVTAKGMKKLLVDEARMQFNSEAFVLFIMSHGAQGRVYGNDGKYLDIEEDIVPVFDGKNCPELINKPKIFFIQACQGGLC